VSPEVHFVSMQQIISIQRRLNELDSSNEDHEGEIAELQFYLQHLQDSDPDCPSCD